MKNAILRILIGAILLPLICSIVVSIIGLMRGWITSTHFSDGSLWAGAITFLIGFISLLGYRQRPLDWPPVSSDPADRAKLWAADTFRGESLMAIFGIAGLLLFDLSIPISRLL